MHDAIVIGAGIAGLAAGWELSTRGFQPLILEASGRAGGVIVTETIDGFLIDAGPDALLRQKPAAGELVHALNLGDRVVSVLRPRTAFVLKRGRLVALPEASFLGLPTRLRPLVTTALFSWPARIRMAGEWTRRPRAPSGDESIAAFMRRHFGDEAVTYLADPLLAGIHAGDVERLSVHALFPRLVAAETSHGSVLRAVAAQPSGPPTSGAFLSFAGGIAEIVRALVRALGLESLRLHMPVTRVEAHAGSFTVTTAAGEDLAARAVIVATPAWAADPLLGSIDPALAALCGEIEYVSSATVIFGLRRTQIRHPLLGTGFVVPRVEGRALIAGTWVSSKWPGRVPPGGALLRGFLGGARDPRVLDKSDTELAEIVRDDLWSILGIEGDPILTRVYRWGRATPQYEVGHLARVAEIDRRLTTHPGLFLTGSGYRGTGIPDCVSDARTVASRAAALLR